MSITAAMLESSTVSVLLSHVLSRRGNFCILMPIALADTSAETPPLQQPAGVNNSTCHSFLRYPPLPRSFLFKLSLPDKGILGDFPQGGREFIFPSLSLQIKSFW